MGLTHVVAYEYLVGPIPEGLTLDHACDNPPCCNPDHLRPMTIRDNILRGAGPAALNARKERCPKCGGPYSCLPCDQGRRRCVPCGRTALRRRRADKRKA